MPARHSVIARRVLGMGAAIVFAAGCASASPNPSPTAPAPAAAASANPVAPPASGAASPDARSTDDVPRDGEAWIATQWVEHGGMNIRLVRPDGTGDHPLPFAKDGTELHPAWSADGSTVLFIERDAGDRTTLWAVAPDGSGLRQLAGCDLPCNQVDAPQVIASDPGGVWLNMDADVVDGPPTTFTLARLDLASGSLQPRFTRHGTMSLDGPRISPDGSHAVYEGSELTADVPPGTVPSTALFVVDLASGTERRITDWGLYASQPDWISNDQIVFNTCGLSLDACPGGAMNAYTIRADGTGLRQLTHFTDQHTGVSQVRTTPDGRGFVLVLVDDRPADDARVRQVATMGLDGSDLAPIASPPVMGTHPALRPAARS